ncbi:chemotaxis protein CheW [Sinimarinibacterium sp. NLF-5-8]|uniref:chemotaxis protein CheW n=1 Tax=Sinimarinibacterium sp. NLF-5-8 TaxID=2698684 RepID=UPI00137BDAA2|nr:chemotaxis protein CheW [Sinimarinibacterium sp. NLF-5-8]QHS08720.1 chemotaxis protein CheA [Sinimarinibacterium sp. NLF-5-8]
MATIDLAQFHQTFFEESFEGLDTMEATLLSLDLDAADAEAINTIFRAAHSIKGGAGTFGFSAISSFTHGLETLLDRVRSGQHVLSQSDVDLLLRAVDTTRAMLRAAGSGDVIDVETVAQTQAAIDRVLNDSASAQATQPEVVAAPSGHWKIRFAPYASLFASGNDPVRILRELQTLGRSHVQCDLQRLPAWSALQPEQCYLAWEIELEGDCTEAEIFEVFAWVEDESDLRIEALAATDSPTPPAAAVETPLASAVPDEPPAAVHKPVSAAVAPAASRRSLSESSTIRVGTAKIDALINLVGELVITQAMLQQTAASLDPVQHERLIQGLALLDRNTRELQEAVMSTRMMPVESVFNRFPRMVRDVAAKLGKQVHLQTVGESTELDKGVIERIADPLTHLVRNSLDHGLETAEQRIAAGKDPSGTITLKAAHQGGHIVIEVMDDGRGLNRQKILDKAQQRGIEVPANPADADVWQLIFAPGFSTAEQITDVSGRGVGMDVVKKNIQALSGQIEIASAQGQGMRVIIRLPLTLAILDGMSVRVGEDIFIVPLNCIVESLQPQPGQVRTMTGDVRVVKVRDEYLAVVSLQQLFNIRADTSEPHEGILVLLEAEGRKVAVQVDELVGQQQVVIKSLEANYRRVGGISGATILGDGRVALILDAAELVRGHAARARAAS